MTIPPLDIIIDVYEPYALKAYTCRPELNGLIIGVSDSGTGIGSCVILTCDEKKYYALLDKLVIDIEE